MIASVEIARAGAVPPGAARVQDRHLILWDGDCGFCRACVEWTLARDRRGVLAAIPYQEAPSPPMTPELRAVCRDAVHVLAIDGRVFRAGRACLFVLEQLGWRRAAAIGRVAPFVWLVEAAYRFVASHRPWASRMLRRFSTRPSATA